MSSEPPRIDSHGLDDAYLKEQDEGILEAFAKADHRVLTTNEISEYVRLSDRQLRRRLHDLADRGVVGTRKPGRSKLWWLQEEVQEPLTVRYPTLRFVRDRVSVQLLLLGVLVGLVALLLMPAASIAYGYDVSVPLLSRQDLLRWAIGTSAMAAGFLIASAVAATVGWIGRHLGFAGVLSGE